MMSDRRMGRLFLHPERDVIHEARVIAFGEPLGLRADRAEHGGKIIFFRLGKVAEDMTGHAVLVARMADAEANAAEFGAAMLVD
jgi:hypothetical protein